MLDRYQSEQTVFAVASGTGRVAVTLLRISGMDTGRIIAALVGQVPPARRASVRALRHRGKVLDRAVVIWMPGPGSYTGEDCAELHLHGGGAVLAAVTEALLACGARLAAAGEFTLRAVQHGRMDLTAAEGVADLVAAETEAQRVQALRQMDGELGGIYRGWASRLLALLAQMEALIDFPDEDLPPEVEALGDAELKALHQEIGAHLDDGRRGERLREGLVFAVVGAPNVGKSTLINRLARREVSIVAETPGTTRDVLEARVVLGGVPVTLLDTAGLRDTIEPVEAEGVRRAMQRAADADAIILLQDRSGGAEAESMLADAAPTMVVRTKSDLICVTAAGHLAVSAKTGDGMEKLETSLGALAQGLTATSGPPALTRARHRVALQEAADRLLAARCAALTELRTEDLRLAVRAIASITGEVGIDDVLDSVFSQFCIGK